MKTCVVGDINEDILLTLEKQCCSMFCAEGFKQVVTKPTRDSGTLIDHVCVSTSLKVDTDVSDCYYSITILFSVYLIYNCPHDEYKL